MTDRYTTRIGFQALVFALEGSSHAALARVLGGFFSDTYSAVVLRYLGG